MARTTISGIPVSSGVIIGQAYFLNRGRFSERPRRELQADAVDAELERLSVAFERAETDLAAARDRVPPELSDQAQIIESHIMILQDPKLSGVAVRYVQDEHINAEWALDRAVEDLRGAFSALEDPYIRERMSDIVMVAERVQTVLMGRTTTLEEIDERIILMAHDLTPADTIELELSKIMGIATTMGAKTSHMGILARSLQIPAVVGVNELEQSVNDGDLVVVDGLKGRILIDPDEDELEAYNRTGAEFENYRASVARFAHLPGETLDGFRISVLANVELFEEVAQVVDNGGEGVGLYRTEYTYINRKTLPTEEELFEDYRDMVSIMSPRKVVIRTLDIGADKMMTHFGSSNEVNPALGLRAIRFCMRHPEIFISQLRAILRASAFGKLAVMFPMISGLKELRFAKGLLASAQEDLRREGYHFDEEMPVGIMVELPSAVMMSDVLAQEVDFFSIGTNDLIQYSLGIDRLNRQVSYLYQPLHPSIVRAIKHVVDAGHRAGIEVSVCGEIASDPFCVPVLMGMQVDSLSLGPQAIPGIKRIIRRANFEECQQLLKEVLRSPTASETNRLVKEIIFKRFPNELTFYSSLIDTE